MVFKFSKTLNEDFEVVDGITFEMLMDAALNGDGDFVVDSPGVTTTIDFPEDKWDMLYDVLFNTDEDTLYTDEQCKKEQKLEDYFAQRYNEETQCLIY